MVVKVMSKAKIIKAVTCPIRNKECLYEFCEWYDSEDKCCILWTIFNEIEKIRQSMTCDA